MSMRSGGPGPIRLNTPSERWVPQMGPRMSWGDPKTWAALAAAGIGTVFGPSWASGNQSNTNTVADLNSTYEKPDPNAPSAPTATAGKSNAAPPAATGNAAPARRFPLPTADEARAALEKANAGQGFVAPTSQELGFGLSREEYNQETEKTFNDFQARLNEIVSKLPDGSQFKALMEQIKQEPPKTRTMNPFSAMAMAIANPELAQSEVQNRAQALRVEQANRETRIFDLQSKIVEQQINKLTAQGEFDKALAQAKTLQRLNEAKFEREQFVEETQKSRARYHQAKLQEQRLAAQAQALFARLNAKMKLEEKGLNAPELLKQFVRLASVTSSVDGSAVYSPEQAMALVLGGAQGSNLDPTMAREIMNNFSSVYSEALREAQQQQQPQQSQTFDLGAVLRAVTGAGRNPNDVNTVIDNAAGF